MIKKYLIIVCAVFLLFGLINCGENEKKEESVKQENKAPQEKFSLPAEAENIIGSWIRPDGGYNLEILAFNKNTVDAAYYNPNPIMVSETQWKIQDGYVYMFIKFDDVGYEGSYYSLGYYPDKDMLMGFYYQAVSIINNTIY